MLKQLTTTLIISAVMVVSSIGSADAGFDCGDLSRQIEKAEKRQQLLSPKKGIKKQKQVWHSPLKLDRDDMKELEDFYKLASSCEDVGGLISSGKAARAGQKIYKRLKSRDTMTGWDKRKSARWMAGFVFYDDIYSVWESSKTYGKLRPAHFRQVQNKYSAAIKAGKEKGNAYSNRARASMYLGEVVAAEKDFRRAVSIRADYKDLNRLADMLFEQGRDADDAVWFAERAVGLKEEYKGAEARDKKHKKELAKIESEQRQRVKKREQERKARQRKFISKNFNSQEYEALKQMIKLDEALNYSDVSYTTKEENCIGKYVLGHSVWVEYHCKDGITRVSLPKSISEELIAVAKFNGLRINMSMDMPFIVWLSQQIRKYEESKGEFGVRMSEQKAGAIALNMLNKALKYGKFKGIQKVMGFYTEFVKYEKN